MSAEDPQVSLQADVTPLDFLRAVYMNEQVALPVRMRAAVEALPFIHPKLSVTASINDDGRFAERLEQAIAQSNKVLMSRPGMLIDATPAPPRPPPGPTDATLPPPIPDRRFRRRV